MKRGVIIKKNYLLTGLFIGLTLPLFEGLVDLGLNWIEVAKVKPLKKITVGNIEIADLQEENTYQGETPVMGFQYEPEEDYYEDEDE